MKMENVDIVEKLLKSKKLENSKGIFYLMKTEKDILLMKMEIKNISKWEMMEKCSFQMKMVIKYQQEKFLKIYIKNKKYKYIFKGYYKKKPQINNFRYKSKII